MGLVAATSIIFLEIALAPLVEEFGIGLTHLALGDGIVKCCLPRHVPRQHAILERRGERIDTEADAGTLRVAQRVSVVVVIVVIVPAVLVVVVAVLAMLVGRLVVVDGGAGGVGSVRVEVEGLASRVRLRLGRRRIETCYKALVSRGDVVWEDRRAYR